MQFDHSSNAKFDPLLAGKKEAGRVLGVSPRTVDYLIEKGELKVKRIGRRVLIPYSALQQFAAGKKVR
jgi:excisionase family DNA binding protein